MRLLIVNVLLMLLPALLAAQPAEVAQSRSLVFTGVTVIDATGAPRGLGIPK
jgi:hypothetical protein